MSSSLKDLKQTLEDPLFRLLQCLDVLLCHPPDPALNIEETNTEIGILVEAGAGTLIVVIGHRLLELIHTSDTGAI